MDINNNGYISFLEATYVSESFELEVTLEGKECIEYVAFKDGHVLKRVCAL